MQSLKIVLFLPCYNVENSVMSVLADVSGVEDWFHQIYLIDNGSTDRTRSKLEEFIARKKGSHYRLFFNERNYSLGGSTIIAFREAIRTGADFVVCMHSDGQARVEDLKKFFPFSLSEDFIVGSRLTEGSQVDDYSVVRLVANKFFSSLQKLILRDDVRDIGAFLAFNLHTIRKIPYERIDANMAYHPSLVLYAYTSLPRVKTREFPIHWGKVETSNVNPIIYGLEHLWRLIRFSSGTYTLSEQKLEDFVTREVAPL